MSGDVQSQQSWRHEQGRALLQKETPNGQRRASDFRHPNLPGIENDKREVVLVAYKPGDAWAPAWWNSVHSWGD